MISKITNGANADLTQTYGYDALNRLMSMTATGVDQDFTYEKRGQVHLSNRLNDRDGSDRDESG